MYYLVRMYIVIFSNGMSWNVMECNGEMSKGACYDSQGLKLRLVINCTYNFQHV